MNRSDPGRILERDSMREGERVEHIVRNGGKRLGVTTIDLSGTPNEILAEVERIAELVRGHRAPVSLAGSDPRSRRTST